MRGRALFVACFALVLGCGAAAPAGGHRVAIAKSEDLVLDVEVTGTLKAVDSEAVGAPAIPETWEYKIIRLAPEGSRVEAGKEVVAFDPSSLEQKLREYESEVATLTEELGKTRAESRQSQLNDELATEEARAKHRKAELKAEKPADLTADVAARAAALDRDLARREVEFQAERARSRRAVERAQEGTLASRLERARARVADVKASIAAMSVKARRAGTVVYRQDYRGEKKKVGDGVWRGEVVVQIASLDHMAADGQVDEVDASKVRVGQKVGLRLEAHPDAEYQGKVAKIAPLVRNESPESRVKVIELEIVLDETEALMRPGMRFRGRIEIARIPGVLQLPLAAVRTTPLGAHVEKLERGDARPVPVKLGRRSRQAVEIVSGLGAGDEVLLERPQAPGLSGKVGGPS